MPWVQYDTTTGIQQATNSMRVSDDALAEQGRAQILLADDAPEPHFWNVNITQTPHVLVYSPPPPAPACQACGYVGVYGNYCQNCGSVVSKG